MEQSLIKKEPLGNGFYTYVCREHSFGTDAVLLANFASARQDDAVDLGTGCGIIPLIMLRDHAVKSVTGVDISEKACALAQKAAEELANEKFTVICSNLTDLKGKIEFGCHTLVTCNPPYKAPGAGIESRDELCRAARHETACTLEDIIAVAARLLQTSGRFCVCQRPERIAELIALMRQYKLEPKRLRLVAKEVGREPWLVLLEGKKCAKTGLRIEPTLYVEKNGMLTDEMISVYGSYKEGHL